MRVVAERPDPALNDGGFDERFAVDDPCVPERGEVEGAVLAVGDEFADASTDGRGLLDSVAAEAVGQHEVGHTARRAWLTLPKSWDVQKGVSRA